MDKQPSRERRRLRAIKDRERPLAIQHKDSFENGSNVPLAFGSSVRTDSSSSSPLASSARSTDEGFAKADQDAATADDGERHGRAMWLGANVLPPTLFCYFGKGSNWFV